jgi:hypothetical protein
MGRIVTYVHHYKPPPGKWKAVALEMPTVVATKKSRGPAERATAEAIPRSPVSRTRRCNQTQCGMGNVTAP